jgi:hypothetical protein
MHLAGIGVGELAKFQVYQQETPQPTMKENQVHTIPFIPDTESFLASYESKVPTKLKEKKLEMADQCLLQIAF